jgi:biotin synthase-related radical SAM superfamily protein
MPVIPVFGRQRLEDHEVKANLGYIEKSGLKKQKEVCVVCIYVYVYVCVCVCTLKARRCSQAGPRKLEFQLF